MSSIFSNPPGEENVEQRLNKAKPHMGMRSSNSAMIIPLLFTLLIVPFWAVFVLPFFVVYAVLILAPRFYYASRKTTELEGRMILPADGIPKLKDREFDVVVFGVTGHSGLLLAEYLVMNHVVGKENPLKIALAGRNSDKLLAARATLSHITSYKNCLSFPVIVADGRDEASLEAMCKKTKVVGTTVGPFLKYGEGLARVCARTGTGYCDLTGEVDFARIVKIKYDEIAKKTGARVISFTGFDSVPSDVGTMALSRKFSAKYGGKTPTHVDLVVTKVNGEAQGGTVDTIVNLVENGPPPKIICKDGEKGQERRKAVVSVKFPFYYWNAVVEKWTIPFLMAPVNSKVVQWTNASSGLFEKMTYNECQAMPSFLSLVVGTLLLLMGGTLFLMKPTRDLIFWLGLLPQPGQGPSREKMKSGFHQAILVGRDDEGNVETLVWNAVGDPGGFITAVYQGECCVALVEGMVKEGRKDGGVGAGMTVGESIGDLNMLQRLRNTGYFSIH